VNFITQGGSEEEGPTSAARELYYSYVEKVYGLNREGGNPWSGEKVQPCIDDPLLGDENNSYESNRSYESFPNP